MSSKQFNSYFNQLVTGQRILNNETKEQKDLFRDLRNLSERRAIDTGTVAAQKGISLDAAYAEVSPMYESAIAEIMGKLPGFLIHYFNMETS